MKMLKIRANKAFRPVGGGGTLSSLEGFTDRTFRHPEFISGSHFCDSNPALQSPKRFQGFTLAEMMVVLLILSIIMAAMAPVMTTRMAASKSAENSSPWKYVRDSGKSQAYFGFEDNHRAMIGQREIPATSTENARLIINAPEAGDMSHVLFKRASDILGFLSFGGQYIDGDPDTRYILLGDLASGSSPLGRDGGATLIGNNIKFIADDSDAADVTAFGNSAVVSPGSTAIGSKASAEGYNSLALGRNASATGNNSIAIGRSETRGEDSLAIGNALVGKDKFYNQNIKSTEPAGSTGKNSIAIGRAQASADNSIAIGMSEISKIPAINYYTFGTKSTGTGAVAIGSAIPNDAIGGAVASGYSSIALGSASSVESDNGIAIGNGAKVRDYDLDYSDTASASVIHHVTDAIAIGTGAYANHSRSIAIGKGAIAEGGDDISIGTGAKSLRYTLVPLNSNIAIGSNAMADSQSGAYYNIAIGRNALLNVSSGNNIAIGSRALMNLTGTGGSNIAIGTNACQYVQGSNKTCIGYNSGPLSGDNLAGKGNTDDVIYIGTKDSTVYIPGNIIVGQNALFGMHAVDDKKTYKVYLKAGNKDYSWSWVYLGTDDYKGKDDNFWPENPITVGPYTISQEDTFDKVVGSGSETTSSDRRLKYVGKESTSGLDKIRHLKVFNYTFKKDEKKTPHVGVIAQDLQKVFPDAVAKGDDGFLRIRMEDMFYAVINAIKELDAKVTEILKQVQNDRSEITQLIKQVNEKDKRIKKLEAQNNALEKRLNALESKIK